jgi:hypothetical protein
MDLITPCMTEPAEGSRTAYQLAGPYAHVGAVHEVFLFGAEKTWLVEAQPYSEAEGGFDFDAPAFILGTFPNEHTAVRALSAYVTAR